MLQFFLDARTENFLRGHIGAFSAWGWVPSVLLIDLNTHFRRRFEEVLGVEDATALLARVTFHYTPKHASWLNMAEIEIGILDRQCLNRRLPDRATLTTEVDAWQGRRNRERRGIEWTFTRQDADTKMARHYVA